MFQKFYLVVMLVETTTIDAIIRNLKTNSYKSAADIQQQSRLLNLAVFCVLWVNVLQVAQEVNEDDDIVPGPQTMSLKCPVCRHVPFETTF